jgi:hypothetical protein
MNMKISDLINEIITEWSYRVENGMPDATNPAHLVHLGIVLKEMGLSHIKSALVENLLMEKGKTPEPVKEEEGSFSNPILNKKIKYKNTKGEDKEGFVGNLLRLPAEHPGRKAAEALLPADGSDERDAINKDLGGQGQAEKPEDGKDKEGGEAGGGEEEKAKAAQAMFDPKNDPAMAARMDKEKEVQAQLAKDAEADKEAEKEQEPKEDDGFNPIDVKDVAKEMPQADPETFNGDSDIPDGVTPEQLEQFNTDIAKVAQQVADAKAKGEPAPNINLCDVTVPGTNLYCDDNLGIPRDEMPQFKGTAQPGSRAAGMEVDASGEVDTEPVFKEMLAQKGIKTLQTQIPADKLKATQKDLVGAKVVGMMGALEKDPQHPKITAPIYVSRDGHVIDGHHRWAAIVAYNAAHPDSPIPMKTTVLDMDIKDAIPMANKFAEDMGIAAKKADANKEDVPSEPTQREPANDDPESKAQQFKGKSSGENIQTMEMEGGGFVYGTKHGNTAMVDDIINDVKSKIPKERWKDVVFVGEGGATNDDTGEIEFNDEMKYAAPKFKEFGAGVDTWDGDDMDVHNNESKLYQKQKEKTGLNDNQILAGNWASMVGQGEGEGLDPNDPENRMKAEDYLDDEGKQFLQDAAKEAGLPPIENFDNPTGEKPSEENGWKGTGDRGTLYRLAFPNDNGDKETKINDIQVAFNDARDENLIEKNKQLTAQGKIPITIAGESHVELVDKMTRKGEQKPEETPTEKLPEPEEPSTEDGGVVYSLGGGYYSDTPKGPAQYKVVESIVEEVLLEGNETFAYLLFEATITKKTAKGKTVKLKTIDPKAQKAATKNAKATQTKPAASKRVETNNPNKKNGDEGETIKELSNEEINSILDKFVNSGEATPDEMRDLENGYADQDMAEGYSDDDFYSEEHQAALLKQKVKVRQEPYKIDESTRQQLKKAGFPEKYIKFLERCISTQVNGKKPSVTELIKQGGAGQIQSQFGEVMAMAFMSIKDPQMRRKFADVINSEIQKSVDEFSSPKKASPIATKEWVEASLTHAEAFDSAMDEKYGKGQWRFEGAAWDIRGDVESLGLDYKNKGFSTDVMLRVQPLKNGKPNGPARAQKNSLKKDENIFFFNGSINEVNNFVLNFLDDGERKRVRGYEAIATKGSPSNKNIEERQAAIAAAERITGLKGTAAIKALKEKSLAIRDKAFNKAPQEVKDAVSKVRNFGAAQTASAEKLIKTANTNIKNANNVIDNAKNIDGGDKDFAKFSYKAVKECQAKGGDLTLCIRQKLSAAGEDTTDDRVCKVAVMASKVGVAAGDPKSEKALNKHYSLAVEAGNALMEILPDSPELMGGLMQKLADAFPMKTCMQGEEFMCIDGMKVTQKTLQTVFGVASYEELQKGMKLKRMPNGETILVYGAKDKKGQDIPIGVVGARQKGKGYEGTVGFEISCSDDFALAIAEANSKNGDTSTSNEKARQSIGKRVGKRNAKK